MHVIWYQTHDLANLILGSIYYQHLLQYGLGLSLINLFLNPLGLKLYKFELNSVCGKLPKYDQHSTLLSSVYKLS